MSAYRQLQSLVQAAQERPRPVLRLLVGAGGCGRARGADAVVAALEQAIAERGAAAEVVSAGCNGMCYAQVQVGAQRQGWPRLTYTGLTAERVSGLLEALLAERPAEFSGGFSWSDGGFQGLPTWRSLPFLAAQRRLVTRNLGGLDPREIDDYLLDDGYVRLARVLDESSPDDVIGEVKASNLVGRGGAYFPTAVKWLGARSAAGEPKWLVVNSEEGEPGVFKDRHLLEGDPHRVVEGMLIAAYAIGASRGIFFINGEAHLAQRRLQRALEQAQAHGLLGQRVLGSDFSFEVEVRHGAGGYILGEETAMLESIEGRRAMPRVRPPFPAERGLWGQPTVINNAETIGTLRTVLELGGAGFAQFGLPSGTGTKLIGLSGNISRPGLVEIEFGTTMRTLIEAIGGGVAGQRQLKAVLIGGPSGVLVPASSLDESIQPRGQVPPGTGGWVVLDDHQSIVAVVRRLTEFNRLESCGKCTPCREGTVRLLELLDLAVGGRARAADLQALRELCDIVGPASLCGLGQMAPNPITSALQHFEHEFHGVGQDPVQLGPR